MTLTPQTNTFQTYQGVGIREDLSDAIYNITPTQTPFMSACGRDVATQPLFEWETDSLAAAVTTNTQIEGFDVTASDFPSISPTTRVGNYAQISAKLLQISGSMEAAIKAGRKSEVSYQVSKRGPELKRDMEANALTNAGGNAGGSTTARATATLAAWLKSNVSYATTSGGNPAYTSGVPTVGRTDATTADLRAISETLLTTVLSSIYQSGGAPDTIMANVVNKHKISAFAGIATKNFNLNDTPRKGGIIGAADVYVGEFETLTIIPNRFQRERDVWVLDFEYLAFAFFRQFMISDLAKTGDAAKKLLLVEYGLKVKNEAALGLIADLTTT